MSEASVSENREAAKQENKPVSIKKKAAELGLESLSPYVSDYYRLVNTLYKFRHSFGGESENRKRMVACAAEILKYLAERGYEYTVRAYTEGGNASVRAEVQFAPGRSGIVNIILIVSDTSPITVPAVNFRESGLEYKFTLKMYAENAAVNKELYRLITPKMAVGLVRKAFGDRVARYDANGNRNGFLGEDDETDERAFPSGVRFSSGALTTMLPNGKNEKSRIVWTSYYSAGTDEGFFRISVSDFGRSDIMGGGFTAGIEADNYLREAYEKAKRNIEKEIGVDDIMRLAKEAASEPGEGSEDLRPQRDVNSRISDIRQLCFNAFLGLHKAASEEGLDYGSEEFARRVEACRDRVSESVEYYLGNIGKEDKKYVILSYGSREGTENGYGIAERTLPARSINASAIPLFMDFGIAEPTLRAYIINALKTLKRLNGTSETDKEDRRREIRAYSVIPDCPLSERDRNNFSLYSDDGSAASGAGTDEADVDETDEDNDAEPKGIIDDGSNDKYSYFSRKFLRSYIIFDTADARNITPGSPHYESLPPFLRGLGTAVCETLTGLGVHRNGIVVETDRHGIIHYSGTAHAGIEKSENIKVEGYLGQVFEPVSEAEAGYRVITDAFGDRIAVPSLRAGLIKENYSYGENRYIIPGSSASIVRPVDENDKRSFVNRTAVQDYEERIFGAVRSRLTNAVIKSISAKKDKSVYYGETDLNSVYNQVLISGKLPLDFEKEAGKQDFEIGRMYENYDATRACILAGSGRLLYDREFMNNTSIISEKRSEQALEETDFSDHDLLSEDDGDEYENEAPSELDPVEQDSDDLDANAAEIEEVKKQDIEDNGDSDRSDNYAESEPETSAAGDPVSKEVYALSRIRGERKSGEDHIYAPTWEASRAVVPAGVDGIGKYNELVAAGNDPWKDEDGYEWRVELFDSRATGTAKQQGAVRYFNPLFTVKDDRGLLHTDLEKCRRIAAVTCEVLGFRDGDMYGGNSLSDILAGGGSGEKSEAVNAIIEEKLAEYKKPLTIGENGAPGCPAEEVGERYTQYYRMRRISFSDSELEGIKDIPALEKALKDKARDAVAREAGECAILGLPEMYCINEYNPANRINMSLSHKKCCRHTAYGRREFVLDGGKNIGLKRSIGVGTAYMSVGGWTQDDAFVISREFSLGHRVKDTGGNYRPLGIGDKLCDDSGNKGVVSIVVDRNADLNSAYFTDPAHEPQKRLVTLFRDNPTLDIVGAPYAMTSRNNGGTARAMMRSIKAARRAEKDLGLEPGTLTVLKVNGRELPDGIGYITWTVTDKTVDAKSSIYDPHEDKGRSISHQLVWALDGLGASLFKKEVFRTNGPEFGKAREIMRVLGAELSEENEIVPDAFRSGKISDGSKVFDLTGALASRTRNVRHNEDGTLVFGEGDSGKSGAKKVVALCEERSFEDKFTEAGVLKNDEAVINMESVYPEKNGDISGRFYSYVLNGDHKYLKLPFKITWGRGEPSDYIPVLSKRFRSVYETVEGKQITHEYTKFYQDILESCGKFEACHRIMDLALDVCATAYMKMSEGFISGEDRSAGFNAIRKELESCFMMPVKAYRSELNRGKDGNNKKLSELMKGIAGNQTINDSIKLLVLEGAEGKFPKVRKYEDMVIHAYIGIMTGELTEKELGKKYEIDEETGALAEAGGGASVKHKERTETLKAVSEGLKKIGYLYRNKSKGKYYTLLKWIELYIEKFKTAEECERTAGFNAYEMYRKLFEDNIVSKNNIFKQCFERTRCRGGATAVISPNPTLPLDRVLLPRDFAEKIGLVSAETPFGTLKQECKDNKYSVLIWRDPVLSNGAVRYPYVDIIETREGHEGYDPDDPMNTLKTIALNPSSVKSQEGDFDGDSVGVYVPLSEAEAKSLDAHCRHHLNALNTETVAKGKYEVERRAGEYDTVTRKEKNTKAGEVKEITEVSLATVTYRIHENPYDAYYTQTLDVASGLDDSGAETAASPSHDGTASELRKTRDKLVEHMNELYLELDAVCTGKKEYFPYSVESCSDDDEEKITEGEHKPCRSAEEIRADMKETFDRFSGCILGAQKNSFGCDALCFTDARALFASILPQTLSGAKGSPEKLDTPAMWFGARYEYKAGELTEEDKSSGFGVVCRTGEAAHAVRVTESGDGHTLAGDTDRLAAFLATSMKDWDTGIVGKPAQYAVAITRNYDRRMIEKTVKSRVQTREPELEGSEEKLNAAAVREMPEMLDSMYAAGKNVAAAMAITHPITQSIMGLKKLSKEQILPKQRLYDELTPALLNGSRKLLKVEENGEVRWIKSPKRDSMSPKFWRDLIVRFFSDSDGLDIGVPGYDALMRYSGCLTVMKDDKEIISGLRVSSHKDRETGRIRKIITVPGYVSILDILCYYPMDGNVFRALIDPENASVLMSDGSEAGKLSTSLFGGAVTSLLLPAKRRKMLEKALYDEDAAEKGEGSEK